MDTLPPHVAPLDEPLEEIGDDRWGGPDLREATPLDDMLSELAGVADDPDDYADLWHSNMEEAGLSVTLRIDRDGERHLGVGTPMDVQVRHRNRYSHFLLEDLRKDSRRRDSLIRQLLQRGRYIDERPARPRETTAAIRGYLATEGRILVDPEGHLRSGGSIPRCWITGTDEDRQRIGEASRAYTRASRKAGADVHIKRVVRMLGAPTSNGWIVLEGRQ